MQSLRIISPFHFGGGGCAITSKANGNYDFAARRSNHAVDLKLFGNQRPNSKTKFKSQSPTVTSTASLACPLHRTWIWSFAIWPWHPRKLNLTNRLIVGSPVMHHSRMLSSTRHSLTEDMASSDVPERQITCSLYPEQCKLYLLEIQGANSAYSMCRSNVELLR